jgi:hypothetical protein
MLLAIGEGQEDLERHRGQGQERVDAEFVHKVVTIRPRRIYARGI